MNDVPSSPGAGVFAFPGIGLGNVLEGGRDGVGFTVGLGVGSIVGLGVGSTIGLGVGSTVEHCTTNDTYVH